MAARPVWAVAAVAAGAAVVASLPASGSAKGCLLSALYLLVEAAGLRSCLRARAPWSGAPAAWLTAALLALLAGDAAYALCYFVLQAPIASTAGTLANVPYPTAFAFLAAGFWARRGREPGSWRAFALPLLVSLPAAYKLLAAFAASARAQPWSASLAIQLANGAAGFTAFNAAFAVALSTRRLDVAVHALGAAMLPMCVWAMSADVFAAGQPSFGLYDYVWLAGLTALAAPLLQDEGPPQEAEPFDARSLVVAYKLGTFALTVLFVGFLALSRLGGPLVHRTIVVGCFAGALVSLGVSHFLAGRVRAFAARMAEAWKEGGAARGAYDGEPVPTELAETLRLAIQREAELRSAELRSELAAQVAHDIRAPLAALEQVLPELHALPADASALASAAVERIRGIAAGLLERARPAEPAGACAFGPLLEGVLAEKRLQHRGRDGLRLESRLEAPPPAVVAEEAQLQRLLSNLIDNAVEAISGPGSVLVRVSREGDALLVVVSDDGKGIPAEVLPRLFQKGGSFGKRGGSGLGLWHARRTAESWGGSLTLASEPGKGTAVSLRLPLA